MFNNIVQNKAYTSLLETIASLHAVGVSIKEDESILSSFTTYLSQHESEISSFEKAADELQTFMANFDFTQDFQLQPMKEKVDALHPLQLEMERMGSEAEKLKALPDRYGLRKAVDTCRNLVQTCRETMRLDEVDSMSALIREHTAALIDIQKKFASDNYILDQIMDTIDADRELLSKFKVCFAELQQYVKDFPHAGVDDLAEVVSYIEILKQANTNIAEAGVVIGTIRGYFNRYNKEEVVRLYDSIVSDMYAKMRFSEVPKYNAKLTDVISQAQNVFRAFEQESEDLEEIYDELSQNYPTIWKERNEQLKDWLECVIDSDSREANVDIAALRQSIATAKQKRNDDIHAMTERYRWLLRKKHSAFHQNLVNTYITYSQYQSDIDEARKERIKLILKTTGKVLLYTAGIPIYIIGGLIYLLFKIIFSSKD